MDEDQEPGRALDEGTDRGSAVVADDQITFQVPRLDSVLGCLWSGVDQHLWLHPS